MIRLKRPLDWQRRLLPFFLSFLVITWGDARAQRPDSVKQHLADLHAKYESHTLSDTAYLKGVDSITPLLYNDDSLEQQLDLFRQIAFAHKAYGKYRVAYYRHLAYSAIARNKYGSAIYYSEKNNEESVRVGIFEKSELLRSELFAISVYDLNKDYARVFSQYNTLRPRLLALAGRIPAGKDSQVGVSIAFSILDIMADAAFRSGDIIKLNEAVLLCERMLDSLRKQPEKYRKYMIFYDFIYHGVSFLRESYWKHDVRARGLLDSAIREVRSKEFVGGDQASYSYDKYTNAFVFYFDRHQKDSARHYLDLVRDLSLGPYENLNIKLPFLLENGSRLEAIEGKYEAAYRDLRRAYDKKDSAFYSVSADKDNNLYALAKEENMHNELIRSQEEKRRAERFNNLFFFIFGLLMIGSVAVFLIYRSRQQQRLLNLRLNLARNFHDEIGPMLLYANTLAKKEAETNPSPMVEELKAQILRIMEAVRGISHDLKTSEMGTVQTFYKEICNLLEKIRASTEIDFTAKMNNGVRILSHVQYTNLRKIVDELITNSIKHAECSFITIDIKAMEQRLQVNYSDNGKGMSPGRQAAGIGLQNIQERVQSLNGDFQLHNAWPKGYSIDISIPLL